MNSFSVQCPKCKLCNASGHLKYFQIGLEEAVLLCDNPKCTYPLGASSLGVPVVQQIIKKSHSDNLNDSVLSRLYRDVKKLIEDDGQTNCNSSCTKEDFSDIDALLGLAASNSDLFDGSYASDSPSSTFTPNGATSCQFFSETEIISLPESNALTLIWSLCSLTAYSQGDRVPSRKKASGNGLSFDRIFQLFQVKRRRMSVQLKHSRQEATHRLLEQFGISPRERVDIDLIAFLTKLTSMDGMNAFDFDMDMEWTFHCNRCLCEHSNRLLQPVIVLPEVGEEFDWNQPHLVVSCPQCSSSGQKVNLKLSRSSPNQFIYFRKGLSSCSMKRFLDDATSCELVAFLTYNQVSSSWNVVSKTVTGEWQRTEFLSDGAEVMQDVSDPSSVDSGAVRLVLWQRQAPTPVTRRRRDRELTPPLEQRWSPLSLGSCGSETRPRSSAASSVSSLGRSDCKRLAQQLLSSKALTDELGGYQFKRKKTT